MWCPSVCGWKLVEKWRNAPKEFEQLHQKSPGSARISITDNETWIHTKARTKNKKHLKRWQKCFLPPPDIWTLKHPSMEIAIKFLLVFLLHIISLLSCDESNSRPSSLLAPGKDYSTWCLKTIIHLCRVWGICRQCKGLRYRYVPPIKFEGKKVEADLVSLCDPPLQCRCIRHTYQNFAHPTYCGGPSRTNNIMALNSNNTNAAFGTKPLHGKMCIFYIRVSIPQFPWSHNFRQVVYKRMENEDMHHFIFYYKLSHLQTKRIDYGQRIRTWENAALSNYLSRKKKI